MTPSQRMPSRSSVQIQNDSIALNVVHLQDEEGNRYKREDDPTSPKLFLLHQRDDDEDVIEGNLDEAWGRINDEYDQLLEDLQERQERLRVLLEEEEEEILEEELRRAGQNMADDVDHVRDMMAELLEDLGRKEKRIVAKKLKRCLRAAAAHEEPDYEALLDSLPGDLQVVHTVPLEQVRKVLTRWKGAITEEVTTLFQGTLQRITSEEAKEMESRGELKIVPSKGVWTMKPPTIPGDKVRRRFRLVLCGNFVARGEGEFDLYAGGVTADTLRAALAIATNKKWSGATSDITAAFLLAEWPSGLPKYGIVPPRVLFESGHAEPGEIWLVLRPLYGLRESPAIWSKCRSDRLTNAKVKYQGKDLKFKASEVDPELWYVYEGDFAEAELLAMIITYVDDIFYLAESELIKVLHAWVEEEWPCSPLQWAESEEGTRYLGIEIKQNENKQFELCQSAYIKNLLRSHGLDEAIPTKLPCPKEWIADEDQDDLQENFSVTELRHGQRIVGEQLWLTMRTRPDLLFPVNYMASRVSKQPNKVAKIGVRLMSYLKETMDMKLVIGGEQNSSSAITQQAGSSKNACTGTQHTQICLTGYSDASFALFGGKSFGASLVTASGSPISWKASKQAFVTLSVMEAELYEASQAATLLESVGCLFDEIYKTRVARLLCVDNSAAVSMLEGGAGSWRTRHLRVRCAHLRSQIEQGLLQVSHIDGERQLADLATKMHGKARLWQLLEAWGFINLPVDAVRAFGIRLCLCLLFASLMVAVDGKKAERIQDEEVVPEGSRLQVPGWQELIVVTILVCVAAIGIWELAKHLVGCCWKGLEESPKQKRLRKLRDAARVAAEEELDRAQTAFEATAAAAAAGLHEVRGVLHLHPDLIPPPPPPPEPEIPRLHVQPDEAPRTDPPRRT